MYARNLTGMRILGPLTVCLVLASCTATTEPDPPAPGSETTRAPTSEPPTPEPSPEPPAEEPLVLAVHATRSVSDVPVAAARRLLARGARSWTAIGQDGEAMQVVSGGLPTGVAPGAEALHHASIALDRVRTSSDTVAAVPASEVDATVRVLTVGGVHPLRSPDDYPVRVPTGAEPGTVVTMTVVGDVMLGRGVGDVLDAAGDPAAVLRPLAERLASADVTVGNLESTLSDNGSPTQADSFAADPAVRRGLRLAGFDALTLANNHLGDFGPVALGETLDLLRGGGFEWFGGGRNLDRARRPLVIEVDGVSTGFYGTESIGETPAATATTGGTNRLNMPPRTGDLDRETLRRIAGDLRRLAGQVDTVVVVPHWGTQYTHVPEPIQRRVARVFARAGADLVLGGHPHWVQGWEQVDDTTVVHSLGNFVFDMDFATQTMEGVFVEIVTWDGEVKAVEPVPYLMDDDFTPRFAPGPSGQSVLDDMWSTSTGPYAVP